ncbi:MAG: D-alanyl-D-alanine carboxypeptidase [Bacilli bacterium]|nr:D-alanyl-D-alanine carboxypeptidase [Bacilli bacterium]
MKRVLGFLLTFVLFIFPFQFVRAEELKLAENAKSAILIEASTGKVLFEKNADEKLVPASMTKMMSMLLIMENIEAGVLKWDQMITVSEHASSMGGSQILLETGEKMSVKDLFKGVAIASGNDAVVALGEAIAGSEAGFVDMMNKKAKELNLKNTNFKTPHGLDAANHYSSARDMSIIARELVKHEKVLEFTSVYEDYLRENTDKKIWLVNTNKLVRFYDGVDGLKTGYTKDAGYCLTGTAKKDGMRIIAVVMGEPDSKTRNKEVSEMLDYSFAQYKIDTLLKKESSVGKYEVNKAKEKYIEVVPKSDVTVLRKKSEKSGNASYEVKLNDLKAPIKKGDVVGKLRIKENGKYIRTIELTTKNDINKANIGQLYLRYLTDIVTGDISI